MFLLNKEDRKIKKIINKESEKRNKRSKIKLNKDDLLYLKDKIMKYHISDEKAIFALASLKKEARNPLDAVIDKYFLQNNLELDSHSLQMLCVVLGDGQLKEKTDNGYVVKASDCHNITDVLCALNANDSPIYLSEELGEELVHLNENGQYGVFIHRPGEFMLVDGFIDQVFMEGMISNGDGLMVGGNFSARGRLDKTFTEASTPPILIDDIKKACAYPYKAMKSYNLGVFIAKIPLSVLENGDPIFYEKEGRMYLHPEYIDGFVNFDGDKIVSYTKNKYIVPDIEPTIGDTFSVHYRGKS